MRDARSTVILCACGDHSSRTCSAESTSVSMSAWTRHVCVDASFHGTSGAAGCAATNGYTCAGCADRGSGGSGGAGGSGTPCASTVPSSAGFAKNVS